MVSLESAGARLLKRNIARGDFADEPEVMKASDAYNKATNGAFVGGAEYAVSEGGGWLLLSVHCLSDVPPAWLCLADMF